eukprot:CAMPEP_0172720066 /NCGR_PEP_ID=MMETSP1074-20121228/76059_1 /TAXON_ID=2916 /ORGANISM="Ceratium fusus, Strain PA161109" /LENGTH=89 /DNA_ID=CAMNT_0013545503 /DNA_START=469 /DNA_END=739 /DNA_ORIENTATION=+
MTRFTMAAAYAIGSLAWLLLWPDVAALANAKEGSFALMDCPAPAWLLLECHSFQLLGLAATKLAEAVPALLPSSNSTKGTSCTISIQKG